MSRIPFVAVIVTLLSISIPVLGNGNGCRCFPGDRCWPSTQIWSAFNSSIDGRLIATTPLASPCHNPAFVAESCKAIQDGWLFPDIHYSSSSSIMSPFFANRSCDPFQPQTSPCLLGNYISYAVDVSKPEHVSRTIRFVKEHNIRLVIRNTGHDYNGKSTGAGAIGLWMHHLRDINVLDYSDNGYAGKAIKVGAGAQFFDINAIAHDNGLVVVGGQGTSVGIAGGYTQGGGHSTLSSRFGLGADQALEWEVIDGQGRFLRASSKENSDLYWALSGGGGGTYGVVWSLTVRAHPESYTTGARLLFTRNNVSEDIYYEAMKQYQARLPEIVDAGAWSSGVFSNTTFFLTLIGYGLHAAEVEALMDPIKSNLTDLDIAFSSQITEYPSWNETIRAFGGKVQVGVSQYGGWLIPRSVIMNQHSDLISAYRNIINAGATVVGFAMKPVMRNNVRNSVLPAWRETLIDTVVALPWDNTAPWTDAIEARHKMTNELIPNLTRLAPRSGAYLNEADPNQPDWQHAFYGSNYEKLKGIKSRYDPSGLFYALGAVGSENWVQQKDGRLCRS